MISMIGVSQQVYAISCEEVTEYASTFIEHHLTHEKLTPELMELTLQNYIEGWDPSKTYFLKSDVEGLIQKYNQTLTDSILTSDCTSIKDVAQIFMKRLNETYVIIKKWINSEHDFSIRETLMLDADYRDFPATQKERQEIWRKRIKYQHLQLLNSSGESTEKPRSRLLKRYELMIKDYNKYNLSDVYVHFLKALGSALDPHSKYLSEDELEEFRISFALSLEGIGVSISSVDGIVRINQILPGGAAFKQGELQAGDKILAVAQGENEFVDVIDEKISQVVKQIRGKRGTMVRLIILRKKSGQNLKKEIRIIREKINLTDAQVQHHHYRFRDPLKAKDYRVGVVVVPSFYSDRIGSRGRSDAKRSVTKDVESATQSLKKQGIDALVIDLRNNGGGGLDEAVSMSGLFMPNGAVVQTKDQDIEVQKSRDFKEIYDGPMVVLVDLLSASASEIFTAAMVDHNRALVVGGEHTFGKGTVQKHYVLGVGKGALNVTTSKFYSPAGQSTQKKGVASHIAFPSLYKELEIGERFRENALAWDQIPATKLFNLNRTNQNIITTLTQLSQIRRSQDPQFLGLKKDILRARENKVDGTPVSLRYRADLKDTSSEAEDKAETQNESPQESKTPALSHDSYLRETLFIAADYTSLLSNQSAAGYYQIFPTAHDSQDLCSSPLSLGLLIGC